jgi:hypothetical protein
LHRTNILIINNAAQKLNTTIPTSHLAWLRSVFGKLSICLEIWSYTISYWAMNILL